MDLYALIERAKSLADEIRQDQIEEPLNTEVGKLCEVVDDIAEIYSFDNISMLLQEQAE